MSIIRSKVQSDVRSDQHGAYEYPVKQHGNKVLPGHKKSSTALVLTVLLVAGITCLYIYSNLSAIGFKVTPVNTSTMMNANQPNVYGKPSLSAKQIDHVLCAAHSTACGTGGALYSGSLKSGVNDSFVMGVFFAESQYGTLGAAVDNHSIGNLVHNGVLIHYANWQASYTDFYSGVKAAGQDNIQTTLDHLYIPGLVNVADLKSARSVEPDLQLVLSTMRKLTGEK